MTSKLTTRQLSKLSGFSTSTVSKALQNSGQVSDSTKRKINELAEKINSSEINIKQLSILSGFSISTVSKALNDSKEISKVTKLKIKEKAKKLNYTPNNSARSLRDRKTKILALVVPKIESLFYSNIISKIQTRAFNHGYRILIMESFFCKEIELNCIDSIRDGIADGVIIIKTIQGQDQIESKITNLQSKYPMPAIIVRVNEFEIKSIKNSYAEKSFDVLREVISNKNIKN